MYSFLKRLGRFSAQHRRLVIATWVAVTLSLLAFSQINGDSTVDNFEVPNVESQHALDLLKERFPERAGSTALVVFHAEQGSLTDPIFLEGLKETMGQINAMDSVIGATDPLANPR